MSLGASAASTCAIPSASLSAFLSIATRREARDLQRQWRQWQAFRASAVAGGGQARCRLPTGTEGAAGEISTRRHPRGRLRRDLARPEKLEWRRHPHTRLGSRRNTSRLPGGDPDDTDTRYIGAAI